MQSLPESIKALVGTDFRKQIEAHSSACLEGMFRVGKVFGRGSGMGEQRRF